MGRWISHDAGWYPIVVACDKRLAAIDPDYVLHESKEKVGTLRYYCAPSGDPGTDVWDAFDDITSDAERASAITCELCGGCGSLHETTCSKHSAPHAPTRSGDTRRCPRATTGSGFLTLFGQIRRITMRAIVMVTTRRIVRHTSQPPYNNHCAAARVAA